MYIYIGVALYKDQPVNVNYQLALLVYKGTNRLFYEIYCKCVVYFF